MLAHKWKNYYFFLFSFIDPVIAVALLVSFVIDTVQDESTEWYEFRRESLMACLVEVRTWRYENKTILLRDEPLSLFRADFYRVS